MKMTHELWWFVLSLCGVTPATVVLAHASGLVLAGMVVGHAVNLIDSFYVD
mgnify:CR=1 FL=1